jgi:ABC superfamily ATP binding cassette transporter, ABC protein
MTVRELAIETKDLTCKFGDFTAVDRLNIKVYSGEIYGFLGSNGSGKSTSIRMLCGILKPVDGTGIVLGYDVVKEPEKVKENIGYMSQKFSLYLDMTVFENLDFYAGMYGLKGEEKYARIEEMIEQMNLKDKRNEFSGNLSGGLKQRLALGCAILHKPRLLFLDEPTSAVDPISRRSFWQIIHALAIGGTTMVVTTHFMEEAEHCDEMVFLDAGKMVAEGSPKKLKDSIKGTLVSIASDDSIKLREEIKKRIPVEDAYIFGRELRVLVAPQDLPLLSDWQYKIIEPTMEDVFSYYLDKKGGGKV